MNSARADMEQRWSVEGWVLAVARHGLAAQEHLSPLRFEPHQWTAFLSACEDHRLLGLLAEAIGSGAVILDEPQAESFEIRYRSWLLHDLVVEQTLVRALDVLRSAGIDALVLKGVALANTVYADPSLRVFGDVDLLVRPTDFASAAALLVATLGASRELPELRPGFDDRFGREILLRVGPVELDLHRTLVDGPFGLTIPLDDLAANPETFEIGGIVAQRLGNTQRFLHSCLAAVLGDWPPRLAALRDIAELLLGGERVGPLDPDAVVTMARRWRVASAVALAIRTTADQLGPGIEHPLLSWARAHRTGLRDRLFLAAYRGRARGYTSQALSVFVLHGWRNRWDYLRAIVRPSQEYLESRGFRSGDRLRKALGWRRR